MKITRRQIRQIINEELHGSARKIAKLATDRGANPEIERIQRKLIRVLKSAGYKIEARAIGGPGHPDNPGGVSFWAEDKEGGRISIKIDPSDSEE